MTWTGDLIVIVMTAMQLLAAVVYLWQGDARQAGMWVAYAIANMFYLSLARA